MQSHTPAHAKDNCNKLHHLDVLFIIASPVGSAHWPVACYLKPFLPLFSLVPRAHKAAQKEGIESALEECTEVLFPKPQGRSEWREDPAS